MAAATYGDYTPLKPFVKDVSYGDGVERMYDRLQYLDVRDELRNKLQITLPRLDGANRVPATPQVLSELFLPDTFLDQVVASSTAYFKQLVRQGILQR